MMEHYEYFNPFDDGNLKPEHREFAKYVDMAMQGRGGLAFRNDSTFHAVYLIYKFFMGAEKDVRIFSGELRCRAPEGSPDADMKIYEDRHVIGAVGAFLSDEGTSLRIVVEKEPPGGIKRHPLVRKLAELGDANELRGSCEIAYLPKDGGQREVADGPAGREVNGKSSRQHMIIMDREAYRLETNDKKAEAVVNFNDKAKVKKLIKDFNSLWDIATPLWSPSAVK